MTNFTQISRTCVFISSLSCWKSFFKCDAVITVRWWNQSDGWWKSKARGAALPWMSPHTSSETINNDETERKIISHFAVSIEPSCSPSLALSHVHLHPDNVLIFLHGENLHLGRSNVYFTGAFLAKIKGGKIELFARRRVDSESICERIPRRRQLIDEVVWFHEDGDSNVGGRC